MGAAASGGEAERAGADRAELGSCAVLSAPPRKRQPAGEAGHGEDGIDSADTPAREHDQGDDPEARRVVAEVLGGNADAFRLLVERESRSLVRACYRVLGDLHEAEDASQEAFVTAYRALGTWRGDGPFGAWLARIGVRIAVRRASRRRPVAWIDPRPMAADREDGGVGEDALYAALASTAGESDPGHLAIRAERAAAVRAAVSKLDEPYREVVALRFFSELSLQEIADQSDRPLGTVKTHLRRGLQRLRRVLEGQEIR
jgi:RNA polymerase sigma-70 factor (ECF subfamily)